MEEAANEPLMNPNTVQTILGSVVQWIVVPLILFLLFIIAKRLAKSATDQDLRASAWAGFWAGLVIFVIVVVSQLDNIYARKMNLEELSGIKIIPLALGFIIGFVILLALRRAAPTRLIGLITLLLSSTSTSALFSYIFLTQTRTSLLYSTLGLAVGVLIHITLFPASVKYLFNMPDAPSAKPSGPSDVILK